ncbi:S-methyl-5'-thioadenosine phosphorylase [Rhodosalinus sediminis]|uniref:S-methyl-5'-thioadenosine phosphorylase n=1 Tax=Rhodosalinus sediminis TaxID=1940533 RepID=UPI0023549A60|nr:S-methyl-5'-thioadenosine phosphorylase [Rhodosalinus sediminis]
MARMIGVIGGSGLYEVEGLEGAAWREVETPWGAPSDAILTGRLDGVDIAFLPRHGRGHPLDPASIPYRANIAALKTLGVTDVISVSAVGSFREAMAPGDFVVVDQFIDRTATRAASFFGPGCVAHVSLAHPTCARLADAAEAGASAAGATVHRGGTYLAMEGPQFSTLAESRMYREVWGADVIGMTNMPEARLAREAELCYVTVAMVTDYDSWHPDHGEVEITQILATAGANADKARAMIRALPGLLSGPDAPCPGGCDRALEHAILTAPAARDPQMVDQLKTIAGRVL